MPAEYDGPSVLTLDTADEAAAQRPMRFGSGSIAAPAPTTLDEIAEKIAAQAPPLTIEQRRQLSQLLGHARSELAGDSGAAARPPAA